MKFLTRIARITSKLLLSIVLLVALLLGVLFWKSRNAEIEYQQFSLLKSDDERYSLAIEIGNPVLPYGPHSVIITVSNASDSKVIVTKNTPLANEGMRIYPSNISARWIDTQTAQVCLRGDEQSDACLLINVPSRTITETGRTPC